MQLHLTMKTSHILCTLAEACLYNGVFWRLHITNFPLLAATVAGMVAAGCTVRLEPNTTHTSAFPPCLNAARISCSGSCSPKLMIESRHFRGHTTSCSWLNTQSSEIIIYN